MSEDSNEVIFRCIHTLCHLILHIKNPTENTPWGERTSIYRLCLREQSGSIFNSVVERSVSSSYSVIK